VSRVVSLDAFWQQPFAAALAPAGERGASAFGFHACAKAMLTFAGALGWLVSAFHKSEQRFRLESESGYSRNGEGVVNLCRKVLSIFSFADCQRAPFLE
jgi:hypothetical protein